uniref:Uncharacterized protein n=1 Tax=Anguilla anguilla TaxID=7936 RepID=A0A0E9R182_ANGAN
MDRKGMSMILHKDTMPIHSVMDSILSTNS